MFEEGQLPAGYSCRRRGNGCQIAAGCAGVLWQHPFVDVFKTFNVSASERRGDVVEEFDRQICKRVFRIQGSVSANNFLRLPHSKRSTKSLGLTGPYIYLQLKSIDSTFFVVHLDFVVDVINSFRVTLGNMFSDLKAMSRTVQCPCHIQSTWAVICVYVPSLLALCFRFRSPSPSFVLRSVQLCSSLLVRKVYTSDVCYALLSLPREMVLELQPAQSTGGGIQWIDVPGPYGASDQVLTPGVTPELSSQNQMIASTSSCSPKVDREGSGADSVREEDIERLPDPMLEVSRQIGVTRATRKIAGLSCAIPRRFAVFVRPLAAGDEERDQATAQSSTAACGVLYASSMTLWLVRQQPRSEACFFGHSRPIELLEASDEGHIVASVQGACASAPPLLRLWYVESRGQLRCLHVLSCPTLTSVLAIGIDVPSRFLVVCGMDSQSRQLLMVWDISRLLAGGNMTLHSRQLSADWDIDCVKFSPFEEQQLVSCGRENIRFWRIKAGHMPGQSVVLNSLARQNHFTCIAFEFNKTGQPTFLGELLAEHQRMFVGTARGKVLQLSYRDRSVQAVYQLHNEAITSLCANEGFVVTASCDGYVRVWPLDFRSFYLHAMHDSSAIDVNITVDGLQILCCTAEGSVGVMDMQSHRYTDLVRSHGAVISDAAISVLFQELVTVSLDGKLKVWSLPTMSQTHEFSVADDVPSVVSFHPGDKHVFAVGFHSGAMRVFDVDGPAMQCEHKHHLRPIVSLIFVPAEDGPAGFSQILTCDETGALAVYDERALYEVVRTPERPLCSASPVRCGSLVCLPPRLLQYMDPHAVALCSLPTLELVRKLKFQSSTVTFIAFSVSAISANHIVVGTADSKLHLFSFVSGDAMATVSLRCGSVHSALLVCPWTSEGNTHPPHALFLCATSTALLRLIPLEGVQMADSFESQDLAVPISRCSPPPTPALMAMKPRHHDEQSFLGHAEVPHRIYLMPNCVISVSSAEIIVWEARTAFFHQFFGKATSPVKTSTLTAPSRVSLDVSGQAALTLSSATEGARAEAGLQIQSDEGKGQASSVPTVESVHNGCGCGGNAFSCETSTAPRVRFERGTCDPKAGTLLEPMDIIPEAAKLASSVGIATVQDELRLQFLCGCSLQTSVHVVAWHAGRGVVCFANGGLLCVEDVRLGGRAIFSDDTGAVTQRMAALPGGEAIAIDLEPSGGFLLAALSAAGFDSKVNREAFGALVWLTVWQLGEPLVCSAIVTLPDAYHTQWHKCRAERPHQSRSDRCKAPLLRLLCGGSRAATACQLSGDSCENSVRCRVDVWGLGAHSSLLYSAEIQQHPLDMVLMPPPSYVDATGWGDEFLMLTDVNIVFWRAPTKEPCDSSCSLCFQLSEAPEVSRAEDNVGVMRCFCMVSMPRAPPGWADGSINGHLLLVATTSSKVWSYNADDNRFLSEVVFAGSSGCVVQAMACFEWPFLLCARDSLLQAWELRFDGGVSGDPTKISIAASQCSDDLLFDDSIHTLHLGPSVWEGLAATAANSLWYFNISEGFRVQIHGFHAMPSRVLRSNTTALVSANSGVWDDEGCEEVPIGVLASGADDGRIRIWAVPPADASASLLSIAQFNGNDMCTSVCFLRPDLLVCAFVSGVMSFYGLSDLALVAVIEVLPGDPLTSVETIGSTTLVVGSGSGVVVELELRLTKRCTSWMAWVERQTRLLGPEIASAVCRIELDRDIGTARRFLVSYACLQVWVWHRGCGPLARGSKCEHALVWPESELARHSSLCALCEGDCAGLLSMPPLSAAFVSPFKDNMGNDGVCEDGALVVVAVKRAACMYVYSCASGSVVSRVSLGAGLLTVVRLVELRLHREGWRSQHVDVVGSGRKAMKEVFRCQNCGSIGVNCVSRLCWCRSGTAGDVHGVVESTIAVAAPATTWPPEAVLLVLGPDCFARLRLDRGGLESAWLEEPKPIVGSAFEVSDGTFRSAPDACLVWSLTSRGLPSEPRLLIKGDAAISCWGFEFGAVGGETRTTTA